MADTAEANENRNEWGDVLAADTLFLPGVKIAAWVGFALIALARVVITIITLTEIIGAEADGSLIAVFAFLLVDMVGVLAFAGAFVYAALATQRMPDWGRVTLLSVALISMAGSSALAFFGLFNL